MSGTYIDNQGNEIIIGGAAKPPVATTSSVGTVKPDGTSINISPDGTINCNNKVDRDAGNLTATGKENIVALGIPDYTAKVSKSAGISYTAETNGAVFVYATRSAQSTGSYTITINNVSQTVTQNDFSSDTCFWFVRKGDVYSVSVSGLGLDFYFCPCIGG